MRKDQKLLVWACVAALAIWVVAPLRVLLLPLIYYNTHVHELCHALAASFTGGEVEYVKVFANGSGVTLSKGGSLFLTSSAGYVGSTIVGGLLVFLSRTPDSARRMLALAAGFLGFGLLFYIRGEGIGVASAIGWIVVLAGGAALLKGDASVFAAQFLGVQQCLTSAHAFLALLSVSAAGAGHSDAMNLQNATGIPAIVWAVAWLALSLVVVVSGLRSSWSKRLGT